MSEQSPDRSSLRASPDAEPQAVTCGDLYEKILGRKVDEAEKQRLWEKAMKETQESEWGSFNTRSTVEVKRVFYEPGNPHAWGDPAIIFHEGEYHFIYLCLAPDLPLCRLISKDGVYWRHAEPVIECDSDVISLNTPTIHQFPSGGPFVLEYTAMHPASFSIRRIAQSDDLEHWHKVENLTYFLPGSEGVQHDGNARFEANYVLLDGDARRPGNVAWRENGWFYGVSCGSTLQKSKDGIHWDPAGRLELNIPTPVPRQADGSKDTFTGFFKFGDRYFVICPSYRELLPQSRVYWSNLVEGPFHPTPRNSALGDFFAYYPRFGIGREGEVLASVDFNECLHMWDRKGDTKKHYVVPPFEQLVCDGKDLWLKYWPGNDVLKAHPIALKRASSSRREDRLISRIAENINFEKGVVIEGEIDVLGPDREHDLALDAVVSATGTVQPRDQPDAFDPRHAVSDDLDTRWVATISDERPEFVLDLGELKEVGRVRIQWALSWSESAVTLQISNDGQNWAPFPGELSKHYVRYVSLFETVAPAKARFLRLSDFGNIRGLVGIRSVRVFARRSENLGENLQSPGLYIGGQGGQPGWAVFLDDARRMRMGYLNADGTHFNYPVERDLTYLNLGGTATFRLIQRGRFFFFYIDDYSMSWLSLNKLPGREIGLISGPRGEKISNVGAWYAGD